MRSSAVEAVGNLAMACATPEFLMQLFKLIVNTKDAYYVNKIAISFNKITHHFLARSQSTLQSTSNSDFPLLAAALVVGGYLSGNISFNISYDAVKPTYYLRGFADKAPFNISINHIQAQWFIYWTPKIIQSFDDGALPKIVADIEKSGLSSASKSIAWFDNLSASSSGSSASTTPSYRAKTANDTKKAYGLTDDAIIDAASTEASKDKCVVM